MKVSIITITYNSAATLPRTLESVLHQTYPDIEHILVDGASSDGTRELIETYAAQHQNARCISEPDEGIYHAINKGIRMATGDIIGLLHSDDVLYSPDSIGQIVAAIERQKAEVVYGDLQYCAGEKWCDNGEVIPSAPRYSNTDGCLRTRQCMCAARCTKKSDYTMSGFAYRPIMTCCFVSSQAGLKPITCRRY